jgi:thiamine kinase-like enzyme
MHAKFATTSAERFASVPLVEYDETFLRTWIGRAIEFGRPVAQIAKKYDRVIERLLTMPRTLIHGECYASNILIDDATTPRRVWMIDWEMAGFAPGLIDLAALTAGKWIAAQKRALAISYYDAFYAPGTPGAPNEPPAVDRFLEDLDFCRLHLAVQWVGWSDHWTPPAAHAQDWLAEANALAEKLLS